MAVVTVSAIASTFNLPNYFGPLFMVTPNDNVFSGLIGVVQEGNGRVENNYEFAINTEEIPSPSQPAILEGDDIKDAVSYGMTHARNVTQIWEESYGTTYSKTGSWGRIDDASVLSAGAPAADTDPFSRQARLALQKMRRDLNYTSIRGSYQNAADPTTTARKTRGILAAVDAGNVVDATGDQLGKAHIDELLRTMWTNGSLVGGNIVIVLNAYQKERISTIYGYAPMDRNMGGVNIKQIETDYGTFGVAMERDMPTDSLLVCNLSVVSWVYNLVKDPRTNAVKGVIFSEPVMTGKNIYQDHIYGEIGLDHGPGVWHGKITGLATLPE